MSQNYYVLKETKTNKTFIFSKKFIQKLAICNIKLVLHLNVCRKYNTFNTG